MREVATYRGRAMLPGAFGPLAMGLAALAAAATVPFMMLDDASRGQTSWVLLVVALMPLGLSWLFLSEGARRLRASGEKGCFLKAGPGGLALRVPGSATRASAYFAYVIWEFDFRWEEVTSLSWTVESGSKRNLVVVARGGSLEIPGRYFQEDSKKILESIRAAAAPTQPPIPRTTL